MIGNVIATAVALFFILLDISNACRRDATRAFSYNVIGFISCALILWGIWW